ncbi:LacI family DNA-binding transcriptional regulator [Devriesea agamarum]|uniref:LacI family DNA-binding transcriptional regulator n=1 Tax=Devriesea agamarum TaxID=472569 RepID=UPI00071C920E|nr:LacI family DNA-binding transcriptional regulator [Devriesea agamarum]
MSKSGFEPATTKPSRAAEVTEKQAVTTQEITAKAATADVATTKAVTSHDDVADRETTHTSTTTTQAPHTQVLTGEDGAAQTAGPTDTGSNTGTKRGRRAGRTTIAEIARVAGVTPTAVSMAVNGRSGVSDATRARILEIAREMNWEPSHAARALAGASVKCIGIALSRPADVLGEEAFFGAFLAGLQDVFSQADYSLQMKIVPGVVEEAETYRRWFAQGRVDGIMLLDLRSQDPRVPVLEKLGKPTLVVGGPGHHGSLPSVWVDDAAAVHAILAHLHSLGHRQVARIGGDPTFLHTVERHAAFARVCVEFGMWGHQLSVGFDPAEAERATRELLSSPAAPTAIVYDSDAMTMAALHMISDLGWSVPGDVSLVSFEDSVACRSYRPSITAIGRDAVDYGRFAARRILAIVEGRDAGEIEQVAATPELIVRESTGPVKGSPVSISAG